MPSIDQAASASTEKWLTVVGIGEDGMAGLGENARRAIAAAEHVFGGKRHLTLAETFVHGQAHRWPVPFDASMRDVLALRGKAVCVLASGDPLHFGVGTTLARLVPAREMTFIPAPSAFSLAAARLGWALQDVATTSLHGRPLDLLRPELHPGRRIIALTSDGEAPAMIAALLREAGFGRSRMTVLEALGGKGEKVTVHRADTFDAGAADPLNVVAIEVEASENPRILTLAAGLPDALFEHDGQITKREIRAVTLSSLAPRHGELLWDVGAGSGSVAIEWMLADPSLRAIAVEGDAERAARIARNATACGVPLLDVRHGNAPAALEGLEPPDAVFIGGGAADEGVLDAAIGALRAGGRLVANAVTLETEALFLTRQARLGGDLIRIGISRAGPVGSMTAWRQAMPVTQWMWVKP
ncbi:bifunctional cobalt-precorrin-7 (C(5))-methyltransferase/cobalt-precorrin-6B (C(15))-methyltransferase [Aquamicrobium sp. LC103]|uniref:bifunctional cobalt-precorrin-7 (C(5))-methyltransferase/cobalt-precorrin-6B (C(15))-methyltransferase n=1 Tax=Aquamicrobium sp. LC103 TaxID=1120658 RepID=UPI00063E7DDF|nr:bifunctional cobalt-precorrin-7 (C(5))-methyltransferase/cobalt-precorrin-6B (C(15))-methyltransferase [Aquamicrobium sp. LC103]TKT76693.1 bifunctional cobalt-precorrin-7 (C(5))-methyltransferase/cobalt-precorrin-6B (C(15))-methyltransferase [Aquamicrobium sp. LC103]